MTKIIRRDPVDWFRVITDLEKLGTNSRRIAEFVHVPRSTVQGWRNLAAQPRHDDAEALIDLWCVLTGNGRDSVHRVSRYSHTA